MTALVTGANGFMGLHLVKTLASDGDLVIGLSRSKPNHPKGLAPNIKFLSADLLDTDKIGKIIRKMKPDRIFHLAAQSLIPRSFKNPQETLTINLHGTLNLLEAVRMNSPKSAVLSVGSSAEYGLTARSKQPVKEKDPLLPQSPYGISKAAQGLFVQMYHRAYGIQGIHVRPFAIIGPGKTGDAVSDLAQGIVAIEQKSRRNLSVGNLDAIRDFVDVRDAVRAMITIAERGKVGEIYNLCSGKGLPLTKILAELKKMTENLIKIKRDPHKFRPLDDPVIIGDPSLLRKLGFRPCYSLNQTLKDILIYWRGRERR